jgi:glutamate dehydrogenase (NADP+)
MSQNSLHYSWTREEVERRLQEIVHSIYTAAPTTGAEYGQPGNLVMGANIAGFVKVADAMIDQGVV